MLILSLDQGTSSSRAILFNTQGELIAKEQIEFEQLYPQSAWVEHNPESIWESQFKAAQKVITKSKISADEILAIGITNQRETIIAWDKNTGKAICNAIVWQDRRTSKYCEELKQKNFQQLISDRTGLIIDPYFSASKIKWILNNIPLASSKAKSGDLCVGTVDSWLVWKLTEGKLHICDHSNASRTMLYNLKTLDWDPDLLDLFGVPKNILPKIVDSSGVLGETKLFGSKIPIASLIGDQQSALFGQLCFKPGMLKNTYGTGAFLMMNTGSKVISSKNQLLTTLAWKIGDQINYALEGSVFVAGALVQWLRDELEIIDSAQEIELLAKQVPNNGGVYFVPAFTGLGAPHWDQNARGSIFGLTRGTKKSHIARAALESIAFQSLELITAMQNDLGHELLDLRVDGGASENNLLLQFQADILNTKIIRPRVIETTALGAAYLAGLAIGIWSKIEDIEASYDIEKTFEPSIENSAKKTLLRSWKEAVSRSKGWAT